MDIASYKGCEIHAVPFQLADTGEWTVNLRIMHDDGESIRWQPWSADRRFRTREEAVAHCFDCGKQLIDKKLENLKEDSR